MRVVDFVEAFIREVGIRRQRCLIRRPVEVLTVVQQGCKCNKRRLSGTFGLCRSIDNIQNCGEKTAFVCVSR
jgi:hypothetical protein